MDGTQENSSFRTICILTIVLALAAPACPSPELLQVPLEDCPGDEYLSSQGDCCNKCHAGYRLERDCENSKLKSVCRLCEPDHYMEKSNHAPKCFRCRRCRLNLFEKELSPCRSTENRKCICIDGYFKQIISNDTWQCLKCTSCGEGEQERIPCSGSTNRECDCKEMFYRMSNKKCEECKTCNDDQRCRHLCRENETDWQLAFMVVICAMCLLVLFTVGMFFHKRRLFHKSQEIVVSSVSSISETSKALLPYINEDGKTVKYHSVPIPSTEQELPVRDDPSRQEKLPDCIPRGFKASHFIYFLLQHVPANRFKELVRCLGVSERDIEWAERDNHTFKEAQYQMLKVWCDSGRGSEEDTLSRARLLELTKTLRGMGLTAGVEAIEANFQVL